MPEIDIVMPSNILPEQALQRGVVDMLDDSCWLVIQLDALLASSDAKFYVFEGCKREAFIKL